MVRGFDLAFESNWVSIPAMGSYCLATMLSSDRTKQICLWVSIYVCVCVCVCLKEKSLKKSKSHILLVVELHPNDNNYITKCEFLPRI